jgi:GNAT superfamily N-acetyltransferase
VTAAGRIEESELPVEGAAVRSARRGDVAQIVALLADDRLGATRELPHDLTPYLEAFDRVAANPDDLLAVATAGEEVVGTLQLTLLPGLARRGALRGQIEAVRVRSDWRGRGLGEALVQWAVGEAGRRGASLVQLTSDRERSEAHRFYERLGFRATHVGYKLPLGDT